MPAWGDGGPTGQNIGGPTYQSFLMGQDGSYGALGGGAFSGLQPGQGAANLQGQYVAAQSQAQAQLQARMANAIDPATGHLLKQPTTQAEYNEVERQAQQLASDSARRTFAQQAQNLGFSSGNLTSLAAGGTGSFSGGAGGTGGAGIGGVSYGDPALNTMFKDNLSEIIKHPGLTPEQMQQLIGQQNEGIEVARGMNQVSLVDRANASGFGSSGGLQAGIQDLNEKAANDKAAADRDARIKNAQQEQQVKLSALGQVGNLLGHQADINHSNLTAYNNLLGQQQPLIPNLQGGGIGFANQTQPQYGGGANQGGGTTSVSGGSGPGAPQMMQRNIQPQQQQGDGNGFLDNDGNWVTGQGWQEAKARNDKANADAAAKAAAKVPPGGGVPPPPGGNGAGNGGGDQAPKDISGGVAKPPPPPSKPYNPYDSTDQNNPFNPRTPATPYKSFIPNKSYPGLPKIPTVYGNTVSMGSGISNMKGYDPNALPNVVNAAFKLGGNYGNMPMGTIQMGGGGTGGNKLSAGGGGLA